MSAQTSLRDDVLPADAPSRFDLPAQPGGSACNFDCTNRFYLSEEALYTHEKSRMSDGTRLRGRDD